MANKTDACKFLGQLVGLLHEGKQFDKQIAAILELFLIFLFLNHA